MSQEDKLPYYNLSHIATRNYYIVREAWRSQMQPLENSEISQHLPPKTTSENMVSSLANEARVAEILRHCINNKPPHSPMICQITDNAMV